MPMPGARAAVEAARAAGLRLGVVTNQSGIGRGYITSADLRVVNARVEELLGPFDTWQHCPHAPYDGCECRKPAPGMVLAALADLGVRPDQCALIGDTGSDMAAAAAAGVRGILLPGAQTTEPARNGSPTVCEDVGAAVRLLLGEGRAD